MRNRPSRLLATAALLPLLLLASCSNPDDPARLLADYNARLSRIIERPLPVIAPTAVPTWPAPRQTLQAVADVRIGLGDFLAFGRCGMLREISERNSGLGRVQASSQRLLYELRLARALQQCADTTAADLADSDEQRREFAALVQNLLTLKQRNLPVVYWNATFGAPELRELFSVAALPVRPREQVPASNAANALGWLAALGTDADLPLPSPEALENQYFQLAGHKAGGRLWLSLDLARRELDRSSDLLEESARNGGICPRGTPTPRAKRLHNLFTGHYVQRIQPWLAHTGRDAGQLSSALERLWQAQDITPPPAMQQYRALTFSGDGDSLPGRFRAATHRHAQAWLAVLQPCGLAPGDDQP